VNRWRVERDDRRGGERRFAAAWAGTVLLAAVPPVILGSIVVQERAGGPISNCDLQLPGLIGGTVTVAFDYPIDLAVPFLPTPASWRVGTARASMRMEQFSQEPYPWPAGDCEGV